MRSIEWDGGIITIVDQTALPHEQDFIHLHNTDELIEAIRKLRVRGAPALGIIGAMGVAQAALRTITEDPAEILAVAESAGRRLRETRPTAVNLGWAIDRVLARARVEETDDPERLADAIVDEALAIQAEDEQACLSIAKNAIEFFEPRTVVLTHCNTGFLVTGGIGTALGAIRYAHESGLGIGVIATETRPLLQGARLTAWELSRLNIPHALVVDAAAPGLIARGEVAMVCVGADRIAANGDVANKIGTYPLALAADAAGIPFVVLAPTSTLDPAIASGDDITVEERDPAEVTSFGGHPIAPHGTQSINPAFDITPAKLVTAIVTERGIARPPFKRALASMLRGGGSQVASSAQTKGQANGRRASKASTSRNGGAKKRTRSPSSSRSGRGAKKGTRR